MDARAFLVLTLAIVAVQAAEIKGRDTHRKAEHIPSLNKVPSGTHGSQARPHPEDKVKEDVQKPPKQTPPVIVCFYTNWAQYRPFPGTYVVSNIGEAADKCTHIIFAFSNMLGNTLVPYEPNDYDMYVELNNLKATRPNLKTSLAVGGWNFGTVKMSLMLATRENRTEFIQNVIQTLRVYNFDGLDMDFEWPGNRCSPDIDKALFTCLCQEMRQAFDAENPTNRLLITVGVGAGLTVGQKAYDIKYLSQAVDQIHLMSYDYFTADWPTTSHHAALYSRDDYVGEDRNKNIDASVKYWVDQGCPKHKLVIGLAFYGRTYTLQNPLINGPGSPAIGPGRMGNYTSAEGFISYYELCKYVLPFADLGYSEQEQVPFASMGDQWIGYDDESSLVGKTTYLKTEQLAGVMIWALDYDDFGGGFCNVGNYPLLTAVSDSLAGYEVPNDPVAPPIPVPEPDPNFCVGKEDSIYFDPYTCTRRYTCTAGATLSESCPAGYIYDRADPTQCIELGGDANSICLTCYEFCSCDNSIDSDISTC